MKLVLIEWIDSYSVYEQWDFLSDLEEPKVIKCKSVGFVVKETKESIMIIPYISGEDEGGKGGICIPKICIVSTTELNGITHLINHDEGMGLNILVTECCGVGPITNENYCPKCGKKINRL